MICGSRSKRKVHNLSVSTIYEPIDDRHMTLTPKSKVKTPAHIERLLVQRALTPKTKNNEYHVDYVTDEDLLMAAAETGHLTGFPGLRMTEIPAPRWGHTLPKPTDSLDLPEIVWTDDKIENCSARMSAASSTADSIDRQSQTSTSTSVKNHLSRGLLRLAIYVNHGHLTVHVHQGRQFATKEKSKCTSYVKVSLIPGQEISSCKTAVAQECNNPKFDEKISFEISEEDYRKRLSVVVMSQENSQDTLLGAMSFGIRHLISKRKQVDGWYYLLSEDVGQRKHLQCVGPNLDHDSTSDKVCKDIPDVNADLKDMECITMVVERAKSGYGFTVMGSSPVTVGRVQKGSTAESAGLQRGDAIVKINGQNVSRSTADSVARIVRMASKHLIVEVSRPVCDKENRPSSCNKENANPRRQHYADNHIHNAKRTLDSLSGPSITLDSFSSPKLPCDSFPSSYNQMIVNDLHDNLLTNSLHSCTPVKRAPSSSKRTPASKRKHTDSGDRDDLSRTMFIHDASVIERYTPAPPDCSYMSMPWEATELDVSMIAGDLNDTTVTDLDCAQTSLQNLTISFQDLSQGEQERQVAISELMEAEQNFIQQMQHGITWYSRPLRHCILGTTEHARLFQNVEKLVALSAFHIRQMEGASVPWVEDSIEGKYVDAIGSVYQPKMRFLCEAYQQYISGLQDALRLYSDLCHYKEFQDFLQRIPSDQRLSVEDFLHKPANHVTELLLHLQTILALTEESHPDYQTLYEVVIAITNFCEKHQPHTSSDHKARSTGSNASFTSRSSSQSRSSLRSTSSVMSIDSEVLEIQSRLLFPKDVHAFQIATSNRHLIYSGELMWVQNGKTWSRVNLLLFNDLLIATQPEKGSYLTVVDSPVILADIASADFSSTHPSEFMLTVDHPSSPHGQRFLTFRAFNIEQKCTWKSLLEQRIAACRSQKELMGSRRGDGSF